MSDTYKIAKALLLAVKYGSTDGSHHKAWVIDQMVRALTGCPDINVVATDSKGKMYEYTKLGESEEYLKLVADAKKGEDGPETYEWDVGGPP